MTRVWRVFRVLVFTRPSVFIVLSLFYLLAAGLVAAGIGSAEKFWLGIAVICAIPTAGIFALAAERIVMICSSAGELGVPRHVAAVRMAQAIMVVAFVCVPALLIAALPGARVWSGVGLALAAALGTALVIQKWVVIGAVVVFFVTARTDAFWNVFVNPYVQAGLFVGAAYLLYRWFLLPGQVEFHASLTATRLADASHEATDEELLTTFDRKALRLCENTLGSLVRRAREEIATRPAAAALALGLGFEQGMPWTLWLKGTGLGALALLAWKLFHGRHPEVLAYGVITGFAVLSVVSRTSSVFDAWQRTPGEQSLMKLTPGWPADRRLKHLFLGAIARGQLGAWLGWSVISALGLVLGSITTDQLATAAFALMAASCGCAGSLAMLLARRSLKEWHLTTIYAVVSSIVGAVIFAVRPPSSTYPSVIAFVLVLLPPAFGLAALVLRPLLFPVIRRQAG